MLLIAGLLTKAIALREGSARRGKTLTRLTFRGIRDFQVAAMFSLYRAMSGARSRCLLRQSSLPPPHLSMLDIPFPQHRSSGCSTFCKSSDISAAAPLGAGVGPRLAVDENSNFITAGLLGQEQRAVVTAALRGQCSPRVHARTCAYVPQCVVSSM